MIDFPIFIKHENGEITKYESYDDIEEKLSYFLSKKEKSVVLDSKGQKLVLNVFFNEVQDLYPEK